MQVNSDFTKPVFISPEQYEWVLSTQPGVERMMLDRIGAEKARATSVVRYSANSLFPAHKHPGGEEILVLSGVFSDETGDYPQGWYIRNPPGSHHTPHSKDGAIIFVKLWQMQSKDTTYIRVDTRNPQSWRQVNGRLICSLFSNETEQTSLQKLQSNEVVFEENDTPSELFIVYGALERNGNLYKEGSWIRLPEGFRPDIRADKGGATLYIKTGAFQNIEKNSNHCYVP